jgi:hypothetical protein
MTNASQPALFHLIHIALTGKVGGEVNVSIECDQVIIISYLLLGFAAEAETASKGKAAHVFNFNIENGSADL